jgi:cytochrome c
MKPLTLLAATLAIAAWAPAQALDVAAAEALAKKSNCMKCHSVSAKKEGPSFKETAAKYKGKGDAEQKLVTHLTTNPKIKVDAQRGAVDPLAVRPRCSPSCWIACASGSAATLR